MWALAWHSIRIRQVIRGPVKHPAPRAMVPLGRSTDFEKRLLPSPSKGDPECLFFAMIFGFSFHEHHKPGHSFLSYF